MIILKIILISILDFERDKNLDIHNRIDYD